jgi:hypothetical protein
MPNITEQRKLAAIMFTDLVGYSALSQRDEKLALALRWLERALANRDSFNLGWIKANPPFEELRDHPWFEALAKQVLAPKTDAKR